MTMSWRVCSLLLLLVLVLPTCTEPLPQTTQSSSGIMCYVCDALNSSKPCHVGNISKENCQHGCYAETLGSVCMHRGGCIPQVAPRKDSMHYANCTTDLCNDDIIKRLNCKESLDENVTETTTIPTTTLVATATTSARTTGSIGQSTTSPDKDKG